ncbi:MAG: electron transfer flavoprotein-ubiquinone oxidoreductase [Oligoflexia bacterium]|nr:electron transfer flavoprotein-ubiquinone oxidoreductase [Oligoflexia bacterium]
MSDSIQRETMDVDVLFVGGGVASLSGAIHLTNLVKKHNAEIAAGTKSGSALADPMIAVVEKASELGAHSLSGAVMNPVALKELIPDYKEKGCPIEAVANYDAVYFLGKTWKFKFPIPPPPFKNHGNYIISLARYNRWLGKVAEDRGINIFPGFAATDCLYDGNKVVGVQTGDKGISKTGEKKSNFEPGYILKSKVTIFGEGTRGSLFKRVAQKLGLREGKEPDVFEEGVKEIIQMPPGTVKPGQVIHTMGWPLKKSIGGTFIYTIPNDQIILGLVAFLDSRDPLLDPHRELQRLKTHPFIYDMIKGGKVIAYGGKTLPAGGWFSIPKLYHDGMLVIGDSAAFVDVQKLKGIHLAMKSGMLAAETVFEGLLKNDFSAATLKKYEELIYGSFIGRQLYRVRHFHQTLSLGWLKSFFLLAFQQITGGASLVGRLMMHEDAKTTATKAEVWGNKKLGEDEELSIPKPDGVLFFDKLSSVYLTGTMHDENSPNHLLLLDGNICQSTCYPKYESPCVRFCPASVYEMVPDETTANAKMKLHINYTNCIHCKTCDIKCPFTNIDWTVPEGGGGPRYTQV